MKEYVLTLLVTAAVTYILTPLVRRGAIKAGALHEARDRDVHVVPIPLLGGLAMYGGLAAGLLAAGQLTPLNSVFAGAGTTLSTEAGLLLAGGLIVAMGIVDDRWGMSPISKLAGQVAAGAILVASGCELGWLPLPGGGTFSPSSNEAMVLTILVVVATINAVNFIDGLDGLAAGIVAIAAVSFFLYYYWLTHVLRLSAEAQPALVSAILAGMCLGFLPHNFFPARIFMGDTGSMLLGLLLAYAPISSSTSLDPLAVASRQAYRLGTLDRFPEILPLLLPMAILVIPYADMVMAVFRRTRAGMSPFAPDRRHLHHRLLDIGHSHRSSVLIMYLWAALFSSSVVWLSIERRPSWVFAMISVGAVLVLLLMSMPRLRWWDRGRRRDVAPAASLAVPDGGLVPAGAAVAGGTARPGAEARPGGAAGTVSQAGETASHAAADGVGGAAATADAAGAAARSGGPRASQAGGCGPAPARRRPASQSQRRPGALSRRGRAAEASGEPAASGRPAADAHGWLGAPAVVPGERLAGPRPEAAARPVTDPAPWPLTESPARPANSASRPAAGPASRAAAGPDDPPAAEPLAQPPLAQPPLAQPPLAQPPKGRPRSVTGTLPPAITAPEPPARPGAPAEEPAEAPPPSATEAPPPSAAEAPPPSATEAPPPSATEAPPPSATEAPPPYGRRPAPPSAGPSHRRR